MDCQETRVDLRKTDPADRAEGQRCARLIFRLNHTMPGTEEYQTVLKKLFGDNLGEGSYVAAPISGACVSSSPRSRPLPALRAVLPMRFGAPWTTIM